MRRLKNGKQILTLLLITATAWYSFLQINYFCSMHFIKSTYPTTNVKHLVSEIHLNGESEVETINILPTTIEFLTPCADKCKFSKASVNSLLIAVKSYIGNFDQRLAIRKTWGDETLWGVTVVFMVGKQDYANELLEAENRIYHDIVQGSFEDRYDNIILKTLMTYKWIVEFCSNLNYVLFVDDDILLNTQKILYEINVKGSFKNTNAMYGRKNVYNKPHRDPKSKWYVSYDEYKWIYYPPYLAGAAIITDINIVRKFNTAFRYVKTFPLDDMYLGIVGILLDTQLVHDDRFSLFYIAPENMKDYFSSHGYDKRGSLLNGWNKLNARK